MQVSLPWGRGALSFALLAFLSSQSCSAPDSSGDGDGGGSNSGDGDGDGDLDLGTGGGGIDDVDLREQPTPATCGDGVLDPQEACDDANLLSEDGCYENCLLVEEGFICPEPGESCRPYAKCGDGAVSFPEECDDNNQRVGDGCSEYCKVEIGSKCEGQPSQCTDTTCGDMLVEGAEGCDDGNPVPFDGCDENCQWEPTCGAPGTATGCTSFCGDGILFGEEQCDDGNQISGDGCSNECTQEDGYTCEVAPCDRIGDQCVLRVSAVYRDFTDSHPNFASGGGSITTGLVESDLVDGKPVYTALNGQTASMSAQDNVNSWYVEGDDHSTIVSEIILFANENGGYVNTYLADGTRYDSSLNGAMDGNPLFFPIDDFPACGTDEWFNCTLTDTTHNGEIPYPYENWLAQSPPVQHNFSFTSEVAYWFLYDAGAPAVLDFLGDDDLWVFINGKLAIDLGGKHVPESAQITLDAATNTALGLGLVDGTVYPIRIFHAERNPVGSSFRLTLSGFRTERSLCTPDCGDGIVAGSEECDDGENDGGHNECQPGCALATYCGDGKVNGDEVCDDADPNRPANCSGCRLIVVL